MCATKFSNPQPEARYIIGIDLGTTNTLVSYTDFSGTRLASDHIKSQFKSPAIQCLPIPQLIDRGEVFERPSLPSFRFHPAEGQFSSGDTKLPFTMTPVSGDQPKIIFGEWARRLGVETQGRLVHSAKSWLSQPGDSQYAAVLPWGDEDLNLSKVSPGVATASYLNYVRLVWNDRFPEACMEKQHVVVTVPASFDEVARALTVEAIHGLGFVNAYLLEEPTAAMYHWYYRQYHSEPNDKQDDELDLLIQGDEEEAKNIVLVCDVGGGTTDFTLARLSPDREVGFKLKRLAVGDHLLLGGDNMDWSLAHQARQAMLETQPSLKLSNGQWMQLVQQCRQAKEDLFSNPELKEASISILGRGKSLLGSQLRTKLTRQEVESILVEGFFPIVNFDATTIKKTSALVAQGLSYAADAAITRHLAQFLRAHMAETKGNMPAKVLFNGGVFTSDHFKTRIIAQLSKWSGRSVTELPSQNMDAAVCYGAVVYGLAQKGLFHKIQGGSARAYFLKVAQEADASDAKALCILPRGTEENTPLTTDQVFNLRVGEQVRFDLLSSTQDAEAGFGQVYPLSDHWVELPSLVIELNLEQNQSERSNQAIPVKLVSELSDLGVLVVKCVEVHAHSEGKQNTWRLQFNTRKFGAEQFDTSAKSTSDSPLLQSEKWLSAKEKIAEVFGPSQKKPDPKQVKKLRSELEKLLGSRVSWDMSLLRAMADHLLLFKKNRRRSPQHERLWFNLLGFALRPGLGDAGDQARIDALQLLWQQGLAHPKEAQNWVDWWTCWRRISAGLSPAFQQQLWQSIKPLLNPGSSNSPKKQQELRLKSLEQMARLAGSLEHLPIDEKTQLANALLKWADKQKSNDAFYWALGRVAARHLFYADNHMVLSAETVDGWIQNLLKRSWKKQPVLAFSATLMGRLHEDHSINVSSGTRANIIDKLKSEQCPDAWLKLIDQTDALTSEDQNQVFGEALPLGLSLS